MKNKKSQSHGKRDVTKKIVFFSIILFVLNLTTIAPSMELFWGCRTGLCSFPLHLPYCATPPHWPYLVISTAWPAVIVLGNLVDPDAHTSLETSPLGNLNSTDITEQSFKPALLTNNSNQKGSKPDSILMQQFWTSNNWGLARFDQRLFVAAMPLINANTVNIAAIAPDENASQNFQSTTEIPSQYIFYKWAFFILALWTIIVGIFDFIQLIKE